MIDLDNFARQLSARTQHRVEDWFDILNAAIHDPAFSQMTDGEIHQLIGALNSPEQLHWLVDWFREAYMRMTKEMPFDFLVKRVNHSPYQLRDWLESLHLVYVNSQSQKKNLDFENIIEYVNNCAKNSAGQSPLPEIVKATL